MDTQKIEQAITDGHLIANKIRKAHSASDIDALYPEIEGYSDFINENFGIIDEYDEKYCELSIMLYVAADEKARHLDYAHDDPEQTGNEAVEKFEQFLDSKKWIGDLEK